jgi:hypothetical protein
MATRTIVTSQPDVECDVCERRLLRGEQPDVFVGAGRRRIVCELCAPRAAHEGWMRETDSQSLALPPLRPRRGRSLIDRLRQVGKPPGDARGGPNAGASPNSEAAPYNLFAEPAQSGADPVPARPSRASAQAAGSHASPASDLAEASAAAGPPPDAQQLIETASETNDALVEASPYLHDAIAVFNSSEFPRRVAGVTRSLGAPMVSVRSAEHLDSVVSIVVAWELCWYRYEVDLSEPVAEAQVMAQGTELGELAREDRLGNAAATDVGMLLLAAS